MDSHSPLVQTFLDNRGALLRYFATRLRSHDAAEDLLHDLYVKLANLSPGTQVDNSLAYIFAAGRNLLLNHLRASDRSKRRDDEWQGGQADFIGADPIVSAPSPETEVSARRELDHILRLLTELPPKTQTIFRLHRFDGLTQAQIAVRLSLSKRTVETHLSTALKHLVQRFPRGP